MFHRLSLIFKHSYIARFQHYWKSAKSYAFIPVVHDRSYLSPSIPLLSLLLPFSLPPPSLPLLPSSSSSSSYSSISMFVRIPENMIYKGLDEDESTFLQFVADRQAERDDELVREEIKEVSAYRV